MSADDLRSQLTAVAVEMRGQFDRYATDCCHHLDIEALLAATDRTTDEVSGWVPGSRTVALAKAWDEGWRAGRGRGPGHTEACPGRLGRGDNPYRTEVTR